MECGFQFKGETIDIAVFIEHGKDMIRVISLPEFKFTFNVSIAF